MNFFLILFVLYAMPVWGIEKGILKLNQTVVSDIIVDDLRGDAAVTIDEVIHDVKSFIHPSLATQERDSLDTAERSSFESTSNETSMVSTHPPYKPIWAIDLSESYMDYDDFNKFMVELLSDLGELQILILSSVSLNDKSWDTLLPLLQRENFKYLDVCSTHYSTHNVKTILERGALLYPDLWLNLSLKFVFSHKSYLNRLQNDIKWVKSCVDINVLHKDWYDAHKNYYKDPRIKQIKEAKALKLLTGDSDIDVDYEESDVFSDNNEDEVVDGLNALSLKDAFS